MADGQSKGGPQKIAMILLLLLSIAGLAYGTYLLGRDQDGSFPFFIGASLCGAFAAIIGAAGKKAQK